MKITILLLISMLVACGSTNKKEIKREQINTDDAKLTGYLEDLQGESCSPYCTATENELDLDKEFAQDEATLVEADGNTCADVVIRTIAEHDVSISNLAGSCLVDDLESPLQVGQETINILEYSDAEGPRMLVEGLMDGELTDENGQAASVREQYTASSGNAIRISERRSRVCCQGEPQVSLSMSLNHTTENIQEAQGIDFLWILVE